MINTVFFLGKDFLCSAVTFSSADSGTPAWATNHPSISPSSKYCLQSSYACFQVSSSRTYSVPDSFNSCIWMAP